MGAVVVTVSPSICGPFCLCVCVCVCVHTEPSQRLVEQNKVIYLLLALGVSTYWICAGRPFWISSFSGRPAPKKETIHSVTCWL